MQRSTQLEQDFDANVEPILQSQCNACHAATLAGPTALALTILATPSLTGGGDPASSQLLTKGEHEGPAFTASQDSVILQWLEEAQSDGY
jgi:mono/diheme cytochrome c family protein